MLERIGFRYSNHIDPFDGGPHYEANMSEVSLIRHFRTATLGKELFTEEAAEVLVGVFREGGSNHFRAVRTPVRWADQDIYLPKEARELLKVKPGERVSVIPFE